MWTKKILCNIFFNVKVENVRIRVVGGRRERIGKSGDENF
jgi:hypothetical protein